MIAVHHLNNSRSQRILWLLEELGLEYRVKHYQRDPESLLAPDSLRAVHPLGKSPVITDGDLTLAESGAIVQYLAERYGEGRLAPALDTSEHVRYLYWLHYAEGSIMPFLFLSLVFIRMPLAPMPFFIRPIARALSSKAHATFIDLRIAEHLDHMEAALGQTEWFAGYDFTAADIQMSFPIEAAFARNAAGVERPHLRAYLEHIHARPAYQRALTKGGEYDLTQ